MRPLFPAKHPSRSQPTPRLTYPECLAPKGNTSECCTVPKKINKFYHARIRKVPVLCTTAVAEAESAAETGYSIATTMEQDSGGRRSLGGLVTKDFFHPLFHVLFHQGFGCVFG